MSEERYRSPLTGIEASVPQIMAMYRLLGWDLPDWEGGPRQRVERVLFGLGGHPVAPLLAQLSLDHALILLWANGGDPGPQATILLRLLANDRLQGLLIHRHFSGNTPKPNVLESVQSGGGLQNLNSGGLDELPDPALLCRHLQQSQPALFPMAGFPDYFVSLLQAPLQGSQLHLFSGRASSARKASALALLEYAERKAAVLPGEALMHHAGIDPELLIPLEHFHGRNRADSGGLYVRAVRVLDSSSRFLPLEVVGLNKGIRPVAESTGLAVGRCRDQALANGLLEVIERDAVKCLYLSLFCESWSRISQKYRKLDLTLLPHALRGRLLQLRDAGYTVSLIDCSTGLGAPVIWAVVEEGAERYCGIVAHLNPERACYGALLEALQVLTIHRDRGVGQSSPIAMSDLCNRAPYHPSFERLLRAPARGGAVFSGNGTENTRQLIDHLNKKGHGHVYRVPLTSEVPHLAACRVVVPTLALPRLDLLGFREYGCLYR